MADSTTPQRGKYIDWGGGFGRNVQHPLAGLVGDGLADERAATIALANTHSYVMPKGTYRYATDTIIHVSMFAGKGVLIQPALGVTVTVEGYFDAGLYQTFDLSLGGKVVVKGTPELRPEWWGAVADDATDSTEGWQAPVDSIETTGDGSIQGSAGIYRITSALVIPRVNGITIKGVGLRATSIRQDTLGQDVIKSATPLGTTNGLVIENIGLQGNGNAPHGLHLERFSRTVLRNVRTSGCTTAGFQFDDLTILRAFGCESDGDFRGFAQNNSGITGLNGGGLWGCSVENATSWGMYFPNGINGFELDGFTIQACAGGMYFGQGATAVNIRGYFEANGDGANPVADIWLGATSFVQDVTVRGTYFNGDATADDYWPIVVEFAQGCTVEENYLNTGTKWVRFEGGSQFDCRFGPNRFDSSVTLDAEALYKDFPARGVRTGNRIDEPQFAPILPGNHIRTDFPTGWNQFISGGGTWAKADMAFRGAQVVANLRRGASAGAQIQYPITIDAQSNAEMRAKLVTFLLPILNDGSLDPASIKARFTGFGSGKATVEGSFNGITVAQGWEIAAVTAFIPANETSFIIDIIIESNNTGFYLGRPVLMIGAAKPTDDWTIAPPRWVSTTMPTTGSWGQGDFVKKSNSVEAGGVGSKYILNGWQRVTTGAGNVLNTDWFEDRRPTGN